jgi:hypothetical protein
MSSGTAIAAAEPPRRSHPGPGPVRAVVGAVVDARAGADQGPAGGHRERISQDLRRCPGSRSPMRALRTGPGRSARCRLLPADRYPPRGPLPLRAWWGPFIPANAHRLVGNRQRRNTCSSPARTRRREDRRPPAGAPIVRICVVPGREANGSAADNRADILPAGLVDAGLMLIWRASAGVISWDIIGRWACLTC